MRKTIYRVTVNEFTWDAQRTFYFETKQQAEEFADTFPVSDKIKAISCGIEKADERLKDTREQVAFWNYYNG